MGATVSGVKVQLQVFIVKDFMGLLAAGSLGTDAMKRVYKFWRRRSKR